MDALNQAIAQISDVLWNSVLLFLLVGTGVYFSVRTRFVQVRKFKTAWNRVFGGFSLKGKKAGKDGMTSFQALATAIAAQVGTGNIAGCATALVSGGPGAIFWMWLAAFFGMATIYGEAYLAQISKRRDESGEVIGGPVYYITHAFKGTFGKALAGFFAVAVILALGFMGNMVQSNSISDAFYTAFSVPKWVMGVIVAVLAAFIFIGGISRIASFTVKSCSGDGSTVSRRSPCCYSDQHPACAVSDCFDLYLCIPSGRRIWCSSRYYRAESHALRCCPRPLL